MKLNILFLLAITGIALHTVSCKKFLDKKSVQSLSTPETLEDLEAILNNSGIAVGTSLLNAMTDEYYFLYSDWMTREELHQKAYAWDPVTNDYDDWSIQYQNVFYANTVLFNLSQIETDGQEQRQAIIRGTALFYRSLALYRIALLFAPQYDAVSAATDPGIPLRLTADINEVSTRSSLQQTYDRIVADLEEAAALLPAKTPVSIVTKTQPTRAAAYGLLARIYLQKGDYLKARDKADACLAIHSTLMDFNDQNVVDTGSTTPFQKFNPEVIFHSMTDNAPNASARARIDSVLYRSYADDDLRKAAYYNKNTDDTYRFKGSYSSNFFELFNGIASDEVYLIRAEARARLGSANTAMQDLNRLLRTRWRSENGVSMYVDQGAANAAEALAIIVSERKKELVYRELRWPDVKRLNKEPAFATTLKRELNGDILLPPNDLRFALLIPREVQRLANLPQNPR